MNGLKAFVVILQIYIYEFSRRFYPKRLIQCIHIICQYACSMGLNPQPLALLTQCSTTEPQKQTTLNRAITRKVDIS